MKDHGHQPSSANKAESYRSFAALLENEEEGRDFIRIIQVLQSPWMIVAPHGGGIEPGTTEIATALAGDNYSLYCLDSLKTNGNELMHITSHDFDDPLCISMTRNAQVVVSIHGCSDEHPRVFVGGRHDELRDKLLASLSSAGFDATSGHGRYPGKHRDNVCNLGQSGAGIQLEISLGLRRKMFASLKRAERKKTQPAFHKLIEAVQDVLLNHDFSL
jgi:phage replication-related protein YjqB (UPF0714/DUF867 family)